MSTPAHTVVIAGHRKWSGLWFGIAAMGSASGIVMVAGGAWAGWFLVITMLPCAVILGMALRPTANELLLDDTGYTIKSVFRSHPVPWSDIAAVGTLDGLHGRDRRVAIKLTDSAAAHDPDAAEIAAAMGGYHRTLPMDYGLDAEELAALMRTYLERG